MPVRAWERGMLRVWAVQARAWCVLFFQLRQPRPFGRQQVWAVPLPKARGPEFFVGEWALVPAVRVLRKAAFPQEEQQGLRQEREQGLQGTRSWRFRASHEPSGTRSPASPPEKGRAEPETPPGRGPCGCAGKTRFARGWHSGAEPDLLSVRGLCERHPGRGRAGKPRRRANRLQGRRARMAAAPTADRSKGLRAGKCPRPAADRPKVRGSGHQQPLPDFSASHVPLAESDRSSLPVAPVFVVLL